jgi:D-alanyl-D-alanine carboxypeptidase (penicillin-binding protein 5/6)
VDVQAESAILINADTGAILFEKNPDKQYYPASITKIATALYSLKLKKQSLDEPITVGGDALGSVTEEARKKSNYTLPAWWLLPGSSHIGLKKGEVLSYKDLLYGMMLASGNDASNAIAEWTAKGSIGEFMKNLNEYLNSLGCKKTCFMNPHGLFHPEHKTTARDMALIMQEALKEPEFRKVISTVTYTRPKTNKQNANTMVQTNRLLRPGPFHYSKTIGGKTGYIQAAQNTFVVAAEEKGRTLIAVLLKSKERSDLWRDSIKLFEAAFNQPRVERVFLKKGPQKFTLTQESFRNPLETYAKEDLAISYYPAEEPKTKGFLYWNALTLPIAKDQQVGEFRVVNEKNEVLRSVPLYAQNAVKGSWISVLLSPWVLGIAALILGMLLFLRFKRA